MRKNFPTFRKSIFFVSVLLSGLLHAQPPAGYYDGAIGLTGEDLHTALYNIIKDHNTVSYTPGVWNAFYTTDVRNGDKIWDIYSDIPSGTPPYVYTVGSGQCGISTQEGDCYSREHSFPSSYFAGASPMYTDIHHIFPVDQYVNGTGHNNYAFSTVASPAYTSLNGSKRGPSSYPGYTGTAFEPIDEYKGDIARAYFYISTRYRNLIGSWSPNSTYADAILNETSYPAFETWFLNLLYAWHTSDPVSQKEIDRNNAIYAIQNNRNPFVDNPDYVDQVWFPSGAVDEPSNHATSFFASAGTPVYSSINLTWTDATGASLPAGYLILGSTVSFEAISAPIDGTPVSDGALAKNVAYGAQAYTFTGLASSTTHYFKIFPYTNSGALIDYKTDGSIPQSTISTTEGATVLQPGDIAIIQYQADDPDKFTFINFTQLAAGTVISFTDNGFSSTTTPRTGEGFLTFTAPSVIPAGTVTTWTNGMDITGTGFNSNNPSGFALATSGDQLMVYQGTWNDNQTLIFALNLDNSSWLTSGSATSNTSYLPLTLTDKVNALVVSQDNGYYNNITSGTPSVLKSLIANPANWSTSNTIQSLPNYSFTLTSSTSINQSGTLLNLNINSSESLTINPGISLTVQGTISNQAGSSGFIIASDATGSGMLSHATDNVPATVQRYIPGNVWDYHLLSSPVPQSIANSGFIPVAGYDLYCYEEASMTWVNYKNTSTSPTFMEVNGPDFVPGRGYMVAYNESNPTKSFAGLLNNGSISVDITADAANPTYQGFNLVGNPYVSAIDWKAASGWGRASLHQTSGGYDFWVYNETAGNYGTYNSSLVSNDGTNGTTRYIPSGQGFFVRAASSGSLSMNNNIRVQQNPTFLKSDSLYIPTLKLHVSAPNGFSDEVLVQFNSTGNISGSPKMQSIQETAPNLWVQNGSERHSIHFPGQPSAKTIPLSLQSGISGQHSISAPLITGLDSQSTITLLDTKTNFSHNLLQTSPYTFTSDPSDNPNRFFIVFGGSIGIKEADSPTGFSCYYLNGSLVISLSDPVSSGRLSIFTPSGQLIMRSALPEGMNTYSLQTSLSPGVYIVSLVNGSAAQSRKLIVQ